MASKRLNPSLPHPGLGEGPWLRIYHQKCNYCLGKGLARQGNHSPVHHFLEITRLRMRNNELEIWPARSHLPLESLPPSHRRAHQWWVLGV